MPAPFGPMTATSSPADASNVTPCSALRVPYSLTSESARRAVSVAVIRRQATRATVYEGAADAAAAASSASASSVPQAEQ